MDITRLFNVKDRVVLVTGGAKGVGRMISEAFVVNGAKVYMTGRDGTAGELAAKELNALGSGRAHWIAADLYSLAACRALVESLSRRESRLDVLVNNSGSNWAAALEDFPDAAWSRTLTLNVQRVFTLTQLLLPLLARAAAADAPARVINIGSIDGLRVPPFETYSYSASKAAVHQLTRTLANRLGANHGPGAKHASGCVTVNAIALGPVESRMTKATLDRHGDQIAHATALGRIGDKEDVAGVCLWLASRAGAWVTGAIVPVDGGTLVKSKL